jgi:large subunit ribosomal protein L10
MPNAQNVANLEALKADLTDISAVWTVDYRGLTVKEVQELRRSIRETGAVMKVYKNTLMHIALEDAGQPSMDEILSGPSAFVFNGADADPVASAKVLKEFAKKNDKLTIKGGVMDGAFVDAAGVQKVASLPSREQVIGQIAGLVAGFARGLAVSINGFGRGLAQVTKAVAEQKPAA